MVFKNFKIGQKLFYGFGLITLLMIIVLTYSAVNFNKQSEAVDLNIKSYNVIRESDQMLINLINMETGSRGFALTGKEDFLTPYNKGQIEYLSQFNELKRLTSDNPSNQDRLIRIQAEYEDWSTYQNDMIISGRRKINDGLLTMEELSLEAQKGIAKQHMDNMRAILNEITKDEKNLLEVRKSNLAKMESQTFIVITIGGSISAILAFIIALLVIRMVVQPVQTVTNTFREISEGDVDLEVRLNVNSNDELGTMSKNFNRFMEKLKELIKENKHQNWLKTGQAEVSEKVRGELDITTLSLNIITYIAKYIDAQIGAFYIKTNEDTYKMSASYAYKRRKNFSTEVKLGEGVVGQSALEKQSIIISNIPEDYVSIGTGIGEAAPKYILVTPCISNKEVMCIVELASFSQFTEEQLQFVELVSESIAITVSSARSQLRMKELLNKTLEQSEELQAQQEELKQSNEELEEQAKALKESESQLQTQQEELRAINEELEERTKSLELQSTEVIANNEKLRRAQTEIESKATALEAANKYKSEFLANMSHELRTPLNSIIVLSQMLAEAGEKSTMTDKQLQYASTIHSSGEDLLKLINDILDLSKVEAGKLDINFEEVDLSELIGYAQRSFSAIAEKKGLSFNVEVDKSVPKSIETDSQRVLQILNNLLSNAFKFTHKGSITVTIGRITKDKWLNELDSKKDWLSISIKDTGIGIQADKQELIFEAFKQSDGTTSRKYGGTGLGLSISKELARLLGGIIILDSIHGVGSTFALILPSTTGNKKEVLGLTQSIAENTSLLSEVVMESSIVKEIVNINNNQPTVNRNKTLEEKKQLLIIEDDSNFSKVLLELAKERGYESILAESGEAGILLAKKCKPDAVLLDIGLPDINGWKVAEKIKAIPEIKDIPIHIISGREEENSIDNMKNLAGYLMKPANLESINNAFMKIEDIISRQCKKLLIVDHNRDQNIIDVLSSREIQVTQVTKGEEALNLLRNETFDCMILEYNLSDMSGLSLLEELKHENLSNLPIIIYTEKSLNQQDDEELQKYTESIIIKGSRSLDRLLAEANLFLHKVDSDIEKKSIRAIRSNMEKEDSFKGKTVLIVDDDMRNVFALTSILEEKGLKIIIGRSGKEAIEKLHENEKIDIVLMDIMMPEMDGYQAMKQIRGELKYAKLPIIAITAKAMKEDRLNCIEAGADDYLTKPIDMGRLISLLRVWLYK